MTKTKHRDISCAIVLDPHGRFLLQQRDNVPGIVQPGKVTLFGGHCEPGESHLECIVREIHEELGYPISPERFESILAHCGPDMDREEGATASVEFFVVRDVPVEAVLVTEGSLLVVSSGDLATISAKLAPFARHVLDFFQKEGKPLANIEFDH